MPKRQTSDAATTDYFIAVIADESTYHTGDQTVEYTITTTPLGMSIEQWFEGLFAVDENDEERYVQDSLGVFADGLQSVYIEPESKPPSKRPLTWSVLRPWLDANLQPEMSKRVAENSVSWGDNSEFDCMFAFYKKEALQSGELPPWFKANASAVDRTSARKTRLSAYLDKVDVVLFPKAS